MGEKEGERGGDEEEEEPMLIGRWTRPPYDPKRCLYNVRMYVCECECESVHVLGGYTQ